jgi:TPR repeat protein
LESEDLEVIAAADSGDPLAQCELAILFLSAKRPAEAITWFTFSAKQFYADAMCFLGRHYLSGEGVSRDEKAGLLWLSRAATKEHPVAQALIAFLQRPEGQQRLKAQDQVALDKMLDNIERRILLTALQETAGPARPD